jgi:hypothetical protein
MGHVTEAQAKTKENAESRLGIVFDKALLKGGQEVAFHGVIQALAPPIDAISPSIAGDPGSLSSAPAMGGQPFGAGHSMGGPSASPAPAVNSTVGNPGAVTNASGAVNGPGVAANGALTVGARGAVGMQGVALSPAAGGAQGSVISSANHNIKLDGGTQLVLQVAGSAAAH